MDGRISASPAATISRAVEPASALRRASPLIVVEAVCAFSARITALFLRETALRKAQASVHLPEAA